MSTELKLPSSIESISLKCSSCGGSVTMKANEPLILTCPFCGASMTESTELMKQLISIQENERNYHLQLKKLEHENAQAKQQARNAKWEHANDIWEHLMDIIPLIIIAALVGGFIWFIMWLKRS